jgi:hypothetical protein
LNPLLITLVATLTESKIGDKKPYAWPLSQIAGPPATIRKPKEKPVRKFREFLRYRRLSVTPGFFPIALLWARPRCVGTPSWDPPLTRRRTEHLDSGIARFAPVFFNRLFTAADENLPLSVVRVKNKPQHLVFS